MFGYLLIKCIDVFILEAVRRIIQNLFFKNWDIFRYKILTLCNPYKTMMKIPLEKYNLRCYKTILINVYINMELYPFHNHARNI